MAIVQVQANYSNFRVFEFLGFYRIERTCLIIVIGFLIYYKYRVQIPKKLNYHSHLKTIVNFARQRKIILHLDLQFISNQSALGVSVISGKPQVHPKTC